MGSRGHEAGRDPFRGRGQMADEQMVGTKSAPSLDFPFDEGVTFEFKAFKVFHRFRGAMKLCEPLFEQAKEFRFRDVFRAVGLGPEQRRVCQAQSFQRSEREALEQVGQGEYSGAFEVDATGTHMIRIGANDERMQSLGQQTIGLVVPYSPEYRASDLDLAKLVQLSEITGGGELVSPEEAFAHNLPSASFAIEIWRQLLLVVALLFPLDVAIRRLIFDREDLLKAQNWVRNVFKRPARKTRGEPRVLENLFEARDRARRTAEPDEKPEVSPKIEKREADQPNTQADRASSQDEDRFARLREAKKRAKKDNQDENS